MAKLTQKSLESIRPDQHGETIRDGGGLVGGVRAKADGSVTVSFYYRYRFNGKIKDFSCGTWPGDSLAKIRANRNSARLRVAQGTDPAAQKKVARQEAQDTVAAKLAEIEQGKNENLTLQDLFDVWLSDGVRREDGNAELKRSFKADVLPALGMKRIKAVTEHDLRGILRAMVGRGVNRAAVVMRNNLAQMFAWAEKRQPWRKLLADGNPMDLIEIEKIVAPDYDLNTERDRILRIDEIRELRDVFKRMHAEYDRAPNKRTAVQPVEKPVQCAIWIMLSTMCRVGELSKARWEHVNVDTGEWFIPKEDVKGKLGNLTVYLSGFTLDQFRQLRGLTGHTEWCFPAKNKDGHVCVKSISKQVGDRQAMFKKGRDGNPRMPMKHRRNDNSLVLGEGQNGEWTPHDLRRTGSTMMQGLKVPSDVIDRCMNHVLPGSKTRRHYFHHDYAQEMRDAWRKLGNRLDQILNVTGELPDNVIPLRKS
jgi:integrase